jgi:hypothetical protein
MPNLPIPSSPAFQNQSSGDPKGDLDNNNTDEQKEPTDTLLPSAGGLATLPQLFIAFRNRITDLLLKVFVQSQNLLPGTVG